MHWQAAHPGPAWSGWPEGTGLSLVDPVHQLWFRVGFLVNPSFAWNLAWFALVGVALAAGFSLGRAVTHREEGGWVGMAALGTSPFLHGVWAFGLTEDAAIGWYALHLSALVAFRRTGVKASLGVAALALLAYCASGPYSTLFAAVASPFAVLWAARGERPWPYVAAVAAGFVLASPVVAATLGSDIVRRAATESPPFDPGWRTAPQGGTDLLRLFLPVTDAVPSGRATYLGVFTVLIALRGVRNERWAAVAAGALLFLALGAELRVAGHRIVPLPAAWMQELLPGVHHWWRAVGPAQVWLAALAAEGAFTAWKLRWERLFAVALLLAADGLVFSGNPWPKEQYDPRPPFDVPGDGAIVLVPFDERAEFEAGPARRYERWAPWWGRPISESYDAPDPLARNRLVAAADAACRGEAVDLPQSAVDGAIAQLRRAGGAHIVLTELCASPEAAADALSALPNDGQAWVVAPTP
jgi:hypothetical protein